MTNRAGPRVIAEIDWLNLPIHPAAETLPMMGEAELKDLAADIERNGLQEPIILFRDNRDAANGAKGPFPVYLLDGRNRLAALRLLGIDNPKDAPKGNITIDTVRPVKALKQVGAIGRRQVKTAWKVDVDPHSMVMSLNVHRRHLTAEQKRQAIADHLKAMPDASDRGSRRRWASTTRRSPRCATIWRRVRKFLTSPSAPTQPVASSLRPSASRHRSPRRLRSPSRSTRSTIAAQPITAEPPGGLTENSPGQTDRIKQALKNAKGAQPKQDEDDDYYGPDDDPEYYVKMVGPEFNVLLAETVDHIHRMVDLVKAVDTDTNREVFDAYSFAVDSVISAARALSAASKDASAIERQKLKAMQEEDRRQRRSNRLPCSEDTVRRCHPIRPGRSGQRSRPPPVTS